MKAASAGWNRRLRGSTSIAAPVTGSLKMRRSQRGASSRRASARAVAAGTTQSPIRAGRSEWPSSLDLLELPQVLDPVEVVHPTGPTGIARDLPERSEGGIEALGHGVLEDPDHSRRKDALDVTDPDAPQ
jgi:hypothetical protein